MTIRVDDLEDLECSDENVGKVLEGSDPVHCPNGPVSGKQQTVQ